MIYHCYKRFILNTIDIPDGIPENLKLYMQALNSTHCGVVITDNRLEDHPIIYCNKAFEEMTGYSHDDIMGHNCRFLQALDRSQPQREEIKEAVRNNAACRVEIRNYKKNGDLFWNELYVSPVKNKEGDTTHFIGVQSDITVRKKMEHDLRQAKSVLSRKVKAKTKGLEEKEIHLVEIIQNVRKSLLVLDKDSNTLSANLFFLKAFNAPYENTALNGLYKIGNDDLIIKSFKDLISGILPTTDALVNFEVKHDFPHLGKKVLVLNSCKVESEGKYKGRIVIAIEDVTEVWKNERRIDDLLLTTSHTLSTPLNTIENLVELLQQMENTDEKFVSTFRKVALEINDLDELITSLVGIPKTGVQ